MPGRSSRRSSSSTSSWFKAAVLIASLAILALLIRLLVVQPFAIPSGSMLPQLMIGDYVIVAKWPYGYSRTNLGLGTGRVRAKTPARGDAIVFRDWRKNEDWVKRVIGLPGDTIEVHGGIVRLNGHDIIRTRIADFAMPVNASNPCRVALEGGARRLASDDNEYFCAYRRYRETLPGGRSFEILDQGLGPADDFASVRVPAGHLFVLGDNRDDSADSRVDPGQGGAGLVSEDQLVGRATLILYSTDGAGELLKPWTWLAGVRKDRIGRSVQ